MIRLRFIFAFTILQNHWLPIRLGWRQFISRKYDSTNRSSWYFQQEVLIPTIRRNRYYLASADPGHPYRWLGSTIWTTLVSYIDYWYQSIREEYSPSFFTCQLLPLIIIFHPPSPINHILSSLFSFHPQASMKQRVNMSVKAFWNRHGNRLEGFWFLY